MCADSKERDIEVVEVNCPYCCELHSYNVRVERPKIMLTRMPGERKKYTMIFTCPKRNQKFEAVIEFYDSPNMKIESVEVLGAVNEDGREQKK